MSVQVTVFFIYFHKACVYMHICVEFIIFALDQKSVLSFKNVSTLVEQSLNWKLNTHFTSSFEMFRYERDKINVVLYKFHVMAAWIWLITVEKFHGLLINSNLTMCDIKCCRQKRKYMPITRNGTLLYEETKKQGKWHHVYTSERVL